MRPGCVFQTPVWSEPLCGSIMGADGKRSLRVSIPERTPSIAVVKENASRLLIELRGVLFGQENCEPKH